MTTETIYTVCCHGCGGFHEERAYFLSVPRAVTLPGTVPGNDWTVPQLGCPECLSDGDTIRQAFEHGMSDEAIERMTAEWPAVRERLATA